MKNNLIENEDYYFDENGYMVFTEKYLSENGECCGNGCRHCPYDVDILKPNPDKSKPTTSDKNEK